MSNQVQVKSRFELTPIKATSAAVMLVAMSTIPVAAATQSPLCGSRPELLKQLSKRFNEAPSALGLAKDGSIIEVLTSDDGSTWTIMISQPNGSSCLVAVGEGWEEVKHVATKGERGA
ncbi:hypothetical protein [Mesorhizobium escarrei]|uniref:Uncharacterized protein n=1 Tax=Mesorhizobium escarrei TaxID=666018 RepID=A0ABM9EHI5_9HYPH|nr:hypothetical protein [Mesorhizobium escarrei]CAH2408305.1 conserved exported hypothetical protein [Mesorhizobium escarrei]